MDRTATGENKMGNPSKVPVTPRSRLQITISTIRTLAARSPRVCQNAVQTQGNVKNIVCFIEPIGDKDVSSERARRWNDVGLVWLGKSYRERRRSYRKVFGGCRDA